MMRLAPPSHPGQFIRTEIIEPLGLSITDAAKALGVTRPTLSALLNQRSALSPEMALRLEKAFGVKMDTLLRMQTAFEIAQARKREGEIKVPGMWALVQVMGSYARLAVGFRYGQGGCALRGA